MFLDVLLGDPRPGGGTVSDELVALLTAGASAGVKRDRSRNIVPAGCKISTKMAPLYVADIPPTGGASDTMGADDASPEESSIVGPRVRASARRLPVQWGSEAYLYPTHLPFAESIKAEGWATLPEVKLPTPAVQLYIDVERSRQDTQTFDVSALPDNLVIGWGWKQRELPNWYTQLQTVPDSTLSLMAWQCRLIHTDNSPYPNNFWPRFWEALGISFSQVMLAAIPPWRGWCGEPTGAPPQKYIYTLIVPAWQLLARASAVPPAAIDAAIRGRAVLIGQNVVGAADAVHSPVHGVVPGVVVHAQALDNLLNWHDRVWRPMPTIDFLPSWISLSWIFALIYLYILKFLEIFLPQQFYFSSFQTALVLFSINIIITITSSP